MNNICVDFSKTNGKIKPLHAVNCAPYTPGLGDNQVNVQKYFEAAKIPFCRLHDCYGAWGGSHFVDVPNIFPDFSADENDPANYDFYYTDEYIGAIEKTNCKTYYRLGVTIEWGSKKYASLPPKDYEKWARICEHIIMHYNKGWADGFEYGIEYWEIWNEPENPGNQFGSSMWGGSREDFYELYKVSSKHLKKCFPEIKIGGYGSCGFYTVTRKDNPAGFETFVPYFTDFLKMVKENDCPLDFYSWHIYTGDERELELHAKFARETLDKYGFENTEAHLNEWNIHSEGAGFAAKHTEEGASFNASVMAMLQHTNYVDMAMYYCFSYTAMYNGLLNQNDKTTDKPWYTFEAFGSLYEMGGCADISIDGERIYAVAASGEDKCGVMISNYMCEDDKTTVSLKGFGCEKKLSVRSIGENTDFDEVFSFTASEKTKITLSIPQKTVIYMEIN